MKIRIVAAAALAAGLVAAGLGRVAEARNANCSGGILYVTQSLAAREKQDLPESKKLMMKAVERLNQCAVEDPVDYEAIGYLGWAYAEVDSFRPAGEWFQKSIAGLAAKGDKKKLEMVSDNRKSFYVRELNAGIGLIRDSQGAFDLTTEPKTDDEKAKAAEARTKCDQAVTHLSNALLIVPPTDTMAVAALKNLGFAYMMSGRDSLALAVYNDAIAKSPNDPSLLQARRALRNDAAGRMVERGDYDAGIRSYEELVKEDPQPTRYGALGDAYFERAQHARPDSAGRPDYLRAGVSYQKGSDLDPKEHTLAYNAGLSFYNARDYAKAEPMFRRAATVAPDNPGTAAYFGTSLAAAKKFDEAAQVFSKVLAEHPKEATVHRMLGMAYNFADRGAKVSEEYLVRKALEDGKPLTDVPAAAAGTAQAKVKEANGAPEQVYQWELKASGQSQPVDTWFYWNKKKAYHFTSGQLLGQTDWSTIDFKGGSR